MTILVTGGAGYIGSHAVRKLKSAGYETLVFDNLIYGHREFVDEEELIVGDLADTQLLDRLFSKHDIKAVMHFAAFAYVGESVQTPSKYYRNNVVHTINLLDSMVKYDVRYMIFSSSCATYGEPQKIPITEEHELNPINPYGRSKFMVEKILQDYERAYGLRSIILRYFNAAGADPDGRVGEDHDPETHLIPLVLDAAMGRLDNIKVFGIDYDTVDGTCRRDYIHVNDLADAHVQSLDFLRYEDRSEIFNLGNGNGFSVNQVIETAKRVTGRNIAVKEVGRRPGDPAVLVGSSEKIESALGWKPRFYRLEDIIQSAWAWHTCRFGKLFELK
jgi:UDP-glucose 4-epimerase